MFNLGIPELIVIGAAGLLLFGPKRLPELAKSLGKGIRDFKKALEDGESEPDNLPKPNPTPPEAEKTKTASTDSGHDPKG